jgi:hypothetical protein
MFLLLSPLFFFFVLVVSGAQCLNFYVQRVHLLLHELLDNIIQRLDILRWEDAIDSLRFSFPETYTTTTATATAGKK